MDIEEIKLQKINRRKERLQRVAERKEQREQKADIQNIHNLRKNTSTDYQDEVRTLIKYTREGYTTQEIEELMGCSEEHIVSLKSRCKKWFTEKQLEKFQAQRKEAKERQVEKKQQSSVKNVESKEEAIDVLQKSLKIMRTNAQREDNLQLSGKENVGTQKRRNFIQGLTRLFNLGSYINNEDIELVLDMFYTSPELANKGNIRFLILNAAKNGGQESAQNMIDELMVSLPNNQYYTILSDYEGWVKGLDKRKLKEDSIR